MVQFRKSRRTRKRGGSATARGDGQTFTNKTFTSKLRPSWTKKIVENVYYIIINTPELIKEDQTLNEMELKNFIRNKVDYDLKWDDGKVEYTPEIKTAVEEALLNEYEEVMKEIEVKMKEKAQRNNAPKHGLQGFHRMEAMGPTEIAKALGENPDDATAADEAAAKAAAKAAEPDKEKKKGSRFGSMSMRMFSSKKKDEAPAESAGGRRRKTKRSGRRKRKSRKKSRRKRRRTRR